MDREGPVDLVGGSLGDLRLLGVGLGLGDRPGLDGRRELALAVGDERADDLLRVDAVRLRDRGDRLLVGEGLLRSASLIPIAAAATEVSLTASLGPPMPWPAQPGRAP